MKPQPTMAGHTFRSASRVIAPCRRTVGGSTVKSTTVEGASCAPHTPSSTNPSASPNTDLTSPAGVSCGSPAVLAYVPALAPLIPAAVA